MRPSAMKNPHSKSNSIIGHVNALPEENPFQSIYSRTYCNHNQTVQVSAPKGKQDHKSRPKSTSGVRPSTKYTENDKSTRPTTAGMIRSNSVIASSNHGLAKNARNGKQQIHKTSSQIKTSLEKALYDNAHKSLTQFVPNRKFGGYDGADEPVSEINFT